MRVCYSTCVVGLSVVNGGEENQLAHNVFAFLDEAGRGVAPPLA